MDVIKLIKCQMLHEMILGLLQDRTVWGNLTELGWKDQVYREGGDGALCRTLYYWTASQPAHTTFGLW